MYGRRYFVMVTARLAVRYGSGVHREGECPKVSILAPWDSHPLTYPRGDLK
jgi:hypothetical protein